MLGNQELLVLISPDDVGVRNHLLEVFDDRWRKFGKEMRRCKRKLSEPSVHDLRVATRRLLSVLEILVGLVPDGSLKKTRQELKKYLKMFGPLRDVQMEITYIGGMMERYPVLESFLTILKLSERRLTKRMEREIGRMRLALFEKRLMIGREHLERVLRNDTARSAVRSALVGVLATTFAKAMGFHSRLDPADTETIHTLRVAFKKFRYTAEALCGLLPGISDNQLESMHLYQQRMGEIQDIEVLAANVRAIRSRRRIMTDDALIQVERELAERREELVRSFMAIVHELSTFWKHGAPLLTYSSS